MDKDGQKTLEKSTLGQADTNVQFVGIVGVIKYFLSDQSLDKKLTNCLFVIQGRNNLWIKERKIRLTASNFGR